MEVPTPTYTPLYHRVRSTLDDGRVALRRLTEGLKIDIELESHGSINPLPQALRDLQYPQKLGDLSIDQIDQLSNRIEKIAGERGLNPDLINDELHKLSQLAQSKWIRDPSSMTKLPENQQLLAELQSLIEHPQLKHIGEGSQLEAIETACRQYDHLETMAAASAAVESSAKAAGEEATVATEESIHKGAGSAKQTIQAEAAEANSIKNGATKAESTLAKTHGKTKWIVGGAIAAVGAVGAVIAWNNKKSYADKETERRAENSGSLRR